MLISFSVFMNLADVDLHSSLNSSSGHAGGREQQLLQYRSHKAMHSAHLQVTQSNALCTSTGHTKHRGTVHSVHVLVTQSNALCTSTGHTKHSCTVCYVHPLVTQSTGVHCTMYICRSHKADVLCTSTSQTDLQCTLYIYKSY